MTTLNTSARALALAAALSALAACAPAPTETTPSAPSASAQPADPATAQTRQLAVGETLDIELEGNPSTGYTWELVQTGEPVLRQEAPPPVPSPAADANTPPVVGAAQPMRWRFVGAQAGKTTLHLVYRRPWEKDEAPVREARYEVEVR